MTRNQLLTAAVLASTVAWSGAGSGAAEKLAVSVEDRIRKLASLDGLKISRRFSPGYCDWAVSQQKMVFQALGDDSAGILLTESCLMIPRKSVSGIVGLAKGNIEDYNPCNTCKKQECPGRR